MPLALTTPALLVLLLVFGHRLRKTTLVKSHWLLWLLGPATIALREKLEVHKPRLSNPAAHYVALTRRATALVAVNSLCLAGARLVHVIG